MVGIGYYNEISKLGSKPKTKYIMYANVIEPQLDIEIKP